MSELLDHIYGPDSSKNCGSTRLRGQICPSGSRVAASSRDLVVRERLISRASQCDALTAEGRPLCQASSSVSIGLDLLMDSQRSTELPKAENKDSTPQCYCSWAVAGWLRGEVRVGHGRRRARGAAHAGKQIAEPTCHARTPWHSLTRALPRHILRVRAPCVTRCALSPLTRPGAGHAHPGHAHVPISLTHVS